MASTTVNGRPRFQAVVIEHDDGSATVTQADFADGEGREYVVFEQQEDGRWIEIERAIA